MDAGQLVVDEIVLGIIRERLAQPDAAAGYVLDGFPRNLAQAAALDEMLATIAQPLDAVVLFEVDYGEIARRISGRRSCPQCGAIYNVNDAATQGITHCPRCPGAPALVQRPDDNEATVTRRLAVYDEQTHPLVGFYRGRGLLRTINAQGSVDAVTRRLLGALTAASGATKPKPKPEAAVAAKPKAKATAKAKTKTKSKAKSQPKVEAKPKPKRKPKVKAKVKAKAKAKARRAAPAAAAAKTVATPARKVKRGGKGKDKKLKRKEKKRKNKKRRKDKRRHK
jgi:adenylate kinase